jgi:hypothetical protein
MGYAISWIAFKDKTSAQVAELLSLAQSGDFEEIPRGMFSGTKPDKGWYVVVINKYGHKFVSTRSLRRVSVNGDVIAAAIEEHVMFSSTEAWTDGNLVWRLTHKGETGPNNLQEQGSLPEQYLPIKQRLFAAQRQEDQAEPEVDHIFNIPLELAEAIVGFKHDKAYEKNFEILKPIASDGLLSRLFRRANR